jgi:hypothetical protein
VDLELGLRIPHHFSADPDPTFPVNTDPHPDPALRHSNAYLRPLVYTDPLGLHFELSRFHCGLPRLHFEPLKLLNFDCNADFGSIFSLLKWIRIQLPEIMRIRILSPVWHSFLDPSEVPEPIVTTETRRNSVRTSILCDLHIFLCKYIYTLIFSGKGISCTLDRYYSNSCILSLSFYMCIILYNHAVHS